MNYPELSTKIQDHIQSLFKSQKDKTFIYHNLEHTQSVVKAASQIANHYQLNEKDFFIVTSAAWFHDAGYFADPSNHEAKSAEMASAFLRLNGTDEETIQAVINCILATRIPQTPKNRLEEIVCDADLFHLGTDDFPKNNKLMRKEAEAKQAINISKDDWRKGTIKLFEMHHYFTDYCQLLLNDQKQEILNKLKNKVADKKENQKENTEKGGQKTADAKSTAVPVIPMVTDNINAIPGIQPQKTKKVEKNARPDRGIETMFRISSSNHQRLSDMADNKAHIMITVNSIILSAVISILLRKLTEYEYLIIPTFILLSISLLAMTFSILATRPSIPAGVFQRSDVDEKRVNLLFFGNFYKMPLEDYTYGMMKMMEDKEFLYGSLIKDVY